ncbi:NAD-dependent epimerase/dehydratase family protein [Membranihabitans marinus]|uniref:NAD-dependent epimerase/dehydratase family protein n=1 Tax=Membranihabitans marinus TaxID=1227546 RepID=UPI001F01CB7B|nr:NAD-dependent epimerase/dehydratase family protein [Membranihabitans marinus]
MQAILGSGGSIGKSLARILPQYTDDIRLVSRKPKKVNKSDILLAGDLMDPSLMDKALRDCKVAYIAIGFPYKTKIWQKTWPIFIKQAIASCQKHDVKLVFFDNVYMYAPTAMPHITEKSPVNPSSKKGRVRASIAQQVVNAYSSDDIQAMIVRSADFYGPSIQHNSLLTETVIKPLSRGKTANWLMNLHCKHSFTYVPDAARATALLGNTPDAYQQIWHLPTAKNPPTGQEWINTIATVMGKKPKYRAIKKWMVQLAGVFSPIMSESIEMLYQYDRDYIFDSSKFEKKFGIQATPYLKGIKEIVAKDYPSLLQQY